MTQIQTKIKFTVNTNNSIRTIETVEGEYINFMCLLRDQVSLDKIGECGGRGRCTTCVIRINGLTGQAAQKESDESDRLSYVGYEDDQILLSCQILINEELEGAEVELLECS